MLASGGRSRAVRQQQQQQQPQISPDNQTRLQRPVRIQRPKSSGDSDDRASSTSSAVVFGGDRVLSNLDRFLYCTTPLVPGRSFCKNTSMKELRTQEDGLQPYFVLGDLWAAFKDWSTCGAGVPLLLSGTNSVVQYYVPYLSGIQLYLDPNMDKLRTRNPGQENDLDSSRETTDVCSESENGRRLEPCLQVGHRQQNLLEATRQHIKGLSINNKMPNGTLIDEDEFVSSQGVLAFEYFARDPPFNREPLEDKVKVLASRFPQINTYKSCDLSSESWLSVAWYPIYRVPVGQTLQNLDSCFLTFHSLSKPAYAQKAAGSGFDMDLKLSLPTFGLASYKYKTSFWEQTGVGQSSKTSVLRQAAADWLQNLKVHHPDYSFFKFH